MKERANIKAKLMWIVITIVIILLVSVWFIRLFSEKHLDDVSPGIQCDDSLLKEADVFYVIPRFEGKNISNEKEWCAKIKQQGKRLAMHGVYHSYLEFETLRDDKYVLAGAEAFKECFGYFPEEFKAPQLALSKENFNILERKYKVATKFNQIFHKSFHCEDTGMLPNWVQKII